MEVYRVEKQYTQERELKEIHEAIFFLLENLTVLCLKALQLGLGQDASLRGSSNCVAPAFSPAKATCRYALVRLPA